MFRRTLIASMIFIGTARASFADNTNFYAGGSLGVYTPSYYNYLSSLTGDAFVGSGLDFGTNKLFYLGWELAAKAEMLNYHISTLHQTQFNLGLSVLPGINVTDKTRLFIRAEDQWRNGMNFGVGIQHQLTNKIDFRAEVDKSTSTFRNLNFSPAQAKVSLLYHFD